MRFWVKINYIDGAEKIAAVSFQKSDGTIASGVLLETPEDTYEFDDFPENEETLVCIE